MHKHMLLGETGSTEEAACSSCPFFDASVVRYPSSYTYPTTYETRSLTAVAGYEHGTSMFTTMDISSTISSDGKYAGGVLGPNGLIYFVPSHANNIGILNLANKNPSYQAGSCMPEAWSSLLSPHFNKF